MPHPPIFAAPIHRLCSDVAPACDHWHALSVCTCHVFAPPQLSCLLRHVRRLLGLACMRAPQLVCPERLSNSVAAAACQPAEPTLRHPSATGDRWGAFLPDVLFARPVASPVCRFAWHVMPCCSFCTFVCHAGMCNVHGLQSAAPLALPMLIVHSSQWQGRMCRECLWLWCVCRCWWSPCFKMNDPHQNCKTAGTQPQPGHAGRRAQARGGEWGQTAQRVLIVVGLRDSTLVSHTCTELCIDWARFNGRPWLITFVLREGFVLC